MKYWKRGSNEYGTMNDDGYVPGSTICTKTEYDTWIAAQPVPPPKPDYQAEFAAAATTNEKITVLAEALGLI
jgi:hypothetical protein